MDSLVVLAERLLFRTLSARDEGEWDGAGLSIANEEICLLVPR